MATRTVIRYVCPQCMYDVNAVLGLPPISPIATCRQCGFRFRRSIGSTASAWMGFGMVWTFLASWAGMILWNLFYFTSVSDFGLFVLLSGVVGLLLGLPGAVLGYVIGCIVGLLNGAAFDSVTVKAPDALNAAAAAQANALAQPSPELQRSLAFCPTEDGPPMVTKRCWHCGHAFEVRDSRWEKVECPQCKANLGVSSPRGEATYDPDQ